MPQPHVVKLRSRAKPLPSVEFPNGSTHQLVSLDAEGFRLVREGMAAEAVGDHDTLNAKALELMARCVPTATTEDIRSLGSEDVDYIFKTCSRQVDAPHGGATAFAAIPSHHVM